MLLLIRGREEEENEEEEEEKEEEVEKEEEDEEEEESFLLSRKLRSVSMSKSILRSEGFTVAVLAGRRSHSMKKLVAFRYLRESMTAWTLVPGLFTTVSASFLISESFLMFFSSSSCT